MGSNCSLSVIVSQLRWATLCCFHYVSVCAYDCWVVIISGSGRDQLLCVLWIRSPAHANGHAQDQECQSCTAPLPTQINSMILLLLRPLHLQLATNCFSLTKLFPLLMHRHSNQLSNFRLHSNTIRKHERRKLLIYLT